MSAPTYLAVLGLIALAVSKIIVVCISPELDLASQLTRQTLYHRARSPLRSVPGPWLSKWTSVVLEYYWFRGQRAFYVERLHRRYGPVVCVSPNEVAFSSIAAAKRIYSYSRPFPKGEFYSRIRRNEQVDNVFTVRDPELHARYRRLLSGQMSENSLKSVEYIVQSRVELAIVKMGKEARGKGAVDILKWWFFFSTDVIGELSFGESFRMLDIGKKNQYAEDLEKVAVITGLRIAFPTLFRIASFLPLRLFRESAAADLRLQRYPEESIQRYRSLIAADPWNPKPTLFTKLFKAEEGGMPHREIVNNAQAYIIAGSDTTAHTLTYLVWAVCRHPDVRRKLAEEVAELPDGYADEDVKQLPYLGYVLHEALRLYSAAPSGLPREVPKGGHEVDGYWIPGGTTVSTQAFSMHRDPAIFPIPESFKPSRWEKATKEMQEAWMPYSGGARACLGIHLANMELRLGIAKFFRTFPDATVSSKEGFNDEDMEQIIYFLMIPKGKRCLIEVS